MSSWFKALLFVAGAIVTVNSTIGVLDAIARRTVRRRRLALGRLRRLAAHVQVDYFTSVLGQPVFSRAADSGMTEHVWVDDYYFVQAFSGTDARVGIYSVTSRSTKFRPSVPFPNGGRYWLESAGRPPAKATLNATRFDQVGDAPERIAADLGARRCAYVEIYRWGNPSNHQSIALSVSQAAPTIGSEFPVDAVQAAGGADLTPEHVEDFRRAEAPNTYTVTAPDVGLDGLAALSGFFGADVDDVRVFTT